MSSSSVKWTVRGVKIDSPKYKNWTVMWLKLDRPNSKMDDPRDSNWTVFRHERGQFHGMKADGLKK